MGLLVDLASMVNVIMEEILYVHQLYKDKYDKPKFFIWTHTDLALANIDSTTLAIQMGTKLLDIPFYIIPNNDCSCVNLDHL